MTTDNFSYFVYNTTSGSVALLTGNSSFPLHFGRCCRAVYICPGVWWFYNNELYSSLGFVGFICMYFGSFHYCLKFLLQARL